MVNDILTKADLQQLRTYLNEAEKVVVTSHMSPDGDAVGSSLGLAHVLRALGKNVHVIVPDDYSRQLSFLPGADDIVIFCKNQVKAKDELHNAHLIFCLDYNDPKRIDRMAPDLESAPAPKVMIDHHLEPAAFCDLTISHHEKSSTCMVLFQVLCALELYPLIDSDAATCILAGMMTDTGNFSYNANDPMIYEIVARLMSKGIDHDELSRRLFNVYSESCLKLNGYAVSKKMQVWKEYGAALITLTREELNRYHYSRGDTEGLVNTPLAIPSVRYSAFFREEERYIKVSMRSLGDFPVNEVCSKYFNGGGHLNAAGGEFFGSMEQAVNVFKSILPENKKLYLK